MRIDTWLELKRTKAFCVGLATLFTLQQAVWGADANALAVLQAADQQQHQLDVARTAAIYTLYDDLYGRLPTDQELRESLDFLHRTPQLAYLVERLAESPESRWRLRQMNPERIAQRKAEAARISAAVSKMVGATLKEVQGSRFKVQGSTFEITPMLHVTPAASVIDALNDETIGQIQAWLGQPQTVCSNCAPNALAPMLDMVGVSVSRETLTTQAFLVDYLSGTLQRPSPDQPKAAPLFISMDAVQRIAASYGLSLNAVHLTRDEFLALKYPMIAALDLTQDGAADHYVVVKDADEARVVYYESDGTRERLPTPEFLRYFTGFALIASADSYGRLLSRAETA